MCFQQNLRKMAVGTDAPGEASVKKKKKKKKKNNRKKKKTKKKKTPKKKTQKCRKKKKKKKKTSSDMREVPECITRDTLYPYGAGNQKKKGRETQRGWKTWAGCLQLSRHMIY